MEKISMKRNDETGLIEIKMNITRGKLFSLTEGLKDRDSVVAKDLLGMIQRAANKAYISE